MAGDWIKMREDLFEDPAVLWMAHRLNTRPEHIVGYLHRFWGWVSRNCVPDVSPENGDKCPDSVPVFAPIEHIGALIGLPEFVEMLCDPHVGWVQYNRKTKMMTITKIDRHLSEGAKTRGLAAEKKRLQRKKTRTEDVEIDVPQKQGPEERRGESSSTKKVDVDNGATIDFDHICGGDLKSEYLDRAEGVYRALMKVCQMKTDRDADLAGKVAILVAVGRLPEDVVADVMNGVRTKKPPAKKPPAYFHKSMTNACRERGLADFAALKASVSVGGIFNGQVT